VEGVEIVEDVANFRPSPRTARCEQGNANLTACAARVDAGLVQGQTHGPIDPVHVLARIGKRLLPPDQPPRVRLPLDCLWPLVMCFPPTPTFGVQPLIVKSVEQLAVELVRDP